jgi:hypothetical protein
MLTSKDSYPFRPILAIRTLLKRNFAQFQRWIISAQLRRNTGGTGSCKYGRGVGLVLHFKISGGVRRSQYPCLAAYPRLTDPGNPTGNSDMEHLAPTSVGATTSASAILWLARDRLSLAPHSNLRARPR